MFQETGHLEHQSRVDVGELSAGFSPLSAFLLILGASFLLVIDSVQTRGIVKTLVSRGHCGRKIARLRRLAAMVAASFLRF